MATIIQDQIQFSKINADTVYKRGGKYTHGSNADGNKFDTTLTGDEITKSFNAVEIDWNGAKPGIGENQTTGITTTGELLSRIKGVYSPVFAN